MAETEIPDPTIPNNAIKAELECEKLRLEIRDIRRWWVRPAHIQVLGSILVVPCAFIVAQANGWFDVQRRGLEVLRDRTQMDIERLNIGRDALNREIIELRAERGRLLAEADERESKLKNIAGELIKLKATFATRQGDPLSCAAMILKAGTAINEPSAIRIVQGNNQSGPAGSTLPLALVVQIGNFLAMPLAGIPVTWQIQPWLNSFE